MEKQFAVKISIWADAYSDECHRYIEGKSVVETFLHVVAADGRRFQLASAGRLRAATNGSCTLAEIEQLREEMEEFFTVYGLGCGENGWCVQLGEEIPPQRMVFEDGVLPCPQISLTLTLDEDWAAAQLTAPAPMFLTRLQEKLGCPFFSCEPSDSPTPAHLRLRVQTDWSVGRIWGAGQDVLKENNSLAHVVEFEVREIQKSEGEQR